MILEGYQSNHVPNSIQVRDGSLAPGNTEHKLPQKKFVDVKKKSSASIKQPKEVDSRRDIDLLFEDMDMQDLSKVVEKGDISQIIELKKKKAEQSMLSSSKFK